MKPNQSNAELSIKTAHHQWLIPTNRQLLRLLIKTEGLQASDLLFDSQSERKQFVREVFLLAARDEVKSCQASPLTNFARSLFDNRKTPC